MKKKTKKDKYYLYYVESCTPKLQSFDSREEMNDFIARFAFSIYDNPDNWVDFAIKGEVLLVDESRTPILKETK